MNKLETTIIIVVSVCLLILLIAPSIPFTNSQFIAQSTDLNYTKFSNGDYNGKLIFIDNNILTGIDATEIIANSLDGGFANSTYTATQRADGGGA